MKSIAIDDEPVALQVIRSLAEKVPFLELQASFVSGTEGFAYLQKQPVDLLFLDIQMPDISGIELAGMIGSGTKVIFTTAHPDFALQGFELAVIDYLLKPIAFPRFLLACQRALEVIEAKTASQVNKQDYYLFVKSGYDLVRIDLKELLYVEVDDNYLMLHEPAKRTLTRMTLSELLLKLPAQSFIRIHRSYVIALDKIEKIERHQITVANRLLPLATRYREDLLNCLGQ